MISTSNKIFYTRLLSYFDDEVNMCVDIIKVDSKGIVVYTKELTTRDGNYVDSEVIQEDEALDLVTEIKQRGLAI